MNDVMIATDKELNAAIRAVLAAGTEILEVYARDFGVVEKDDRSPLTEADTRGHAAIVRVLAEATPDVPILSEEGAAISYADRRGWSRYWLVDPLDGTKEFIKKNDEFTVNVALMHADGDRVSPIAGVVFVPATDTLYVGVVGRGAWRLAAGELSHVTFEHVVSHGMPLPHPGTRANRPYTIVASRSHMSPETQAFVEERRGSYPDLQLISAGSSIKICRVAEGTADEYPRFAPTMEWDTAAGDAVARAAGCEVLRWDAETNAPAGLLEYNKPDLHNAWFLVRRTVDTHQGN